MAGFGGGGGKSNAVRAGAAFVELFAEDNKVYRAMDRLKARFQSFGKFTAKVGLASAGVGAAGLLAFKPAMDSLSETAKIADLAEVFDLTGEKASRLFGILGASGSDLRDAQEGLATFNQRINDAINGKGEEAATLFKELGVAAEEFQPLDTADRLYKFIEAVKASSSPLGKLGLLMKGVGEDTGKNLSSLLTLSADQLRELGDAAESSSADLNTAREASRAMGVASASISRVWREVAVALAPSIKEIVGNVTHAARMVSDFISRNKETVVTVAAVAAGLAIGGIALVAFGAAAAGAGALIGLAVAAVKLLVAGVSLLLSPIGLVVAAVAGFGYLLATETETGRQAVSTLGSTFKEVGSTFSDTWGGIKDAIKAGDLELAFKVAGAGIKTAWAQMLLGLTKMWRDFGREISEGPIGKFHDFMTKHTGVGGPMTADVMRVADMFVAKREKEVEEAKAELRKIVDEAKAAAAKAGATKPLEERKDPPKSPGLAEMKIVAARGTFSGSALAQQLGAGDTFQKKMQKTNEQIEKNTRNIFDAAKGIAQGLRFT